MRPREGFMTPLGCRETSSSRSLQAPKIHLGRVSLGVSVKNKVVLAIFTTSSKRCSATQKGANKNKQHKPKVKISCSHLRLTSWMLFLAAKKVWLSIGQMFVWLARGQSRSPALLRPSVEGVEELVISRLSKDHSMCSKCAEIVMAQGLWSGHLVCRVKDVALSMLMSKNKSIFPKELIMVLTWEWLRKVTQAPVNQET